MPTRTLPDRHPYEIYLLIVFAVYGVASLFNLLPTPRSIDSQVPARELWSAAILIGSLAALWGLAWPRSNGLVVKVTPLLLEQVGLVMIGAALTFYAIAVVATNGAPAAFSAASNLGLGIASFAHARKIQKYIHRLHAVAEVARRGDG